MKKSLISYFMAAAPLIMLMVVPALAASVSQVEEYTLKAVYIEKFTRFVEWPKESEIDDPSKPFVIGIIGENSFEPVMRNLFASRKIRDKKVAVRRVSGMHEIADCHLLFISNISGEKLQKMLSSIKGRPILTVGDTEGFAARGVLINFYFLNNKLRFEINQTAARESGLIFSYLLMQFATVVSPAEGR